MTHITTDLEYVSTRNEVQKIIAPFLQQDGVHSDAIDALIDQASRIIYNNPGTYLESIEWMEGGYKLIAKYKPRKFEFDLRLTL